MSTMAPGNVVAGKFRLQRMLGKGGMGSVWAAEHLGLKTAVAVKFIDAELAARSASAFARFAQEAKAAAAIKSPHVVSVLDFGQDGEGNPYLAMELLRGEVLDARLERDKTIPLEDVRRIVDQACKALQKAHAAGFVHRDLKPDNIFLCEGEEGDGFHVKILDFGLAKESGGLAMTGANEVLGTPDFMSPEQARGREIDFRTDFYSLGVVCYLCLTAHLPYEETHSIPELLLSIVSKDPIPASKLKPDLPPLVDAWLSRAMQKDPARRFDSAKEMAQALRDACEPRKGHVNVPRISVVSEDEAGEEDITVRAMHDPSTAPLSAPPPSGPKASPLPPKDFKVEKTMPLGADTEKLFEAARQVRPPPKSPPASTPPGAASEPPPSLSHPPPAIPTGGLPPFWVFVIALLAVTAAVYLVLQYAVPR